MFEPEDRRVGAEDVLEVVETEACPGHGRSSSQGTSSVVGSSLAILRISLTTSAPLMACAQRSSAALA